MINQHTYPEVSVDIDPNTGQVRQVTDGEYTLKVDTESGKNEVTLQFLSSGLELSFSHGELVNLINVLYAYENAVQMSETQDLMKELIIGEPHGNA